MKRFIKAFTLCALVVMATLSFTFANTLSAETTPQMRLRLFYEAQQKHPDVWNNCTQACIAARLQQAPYLTGLARQANVDLNDLARYSIVRAYDWGLNFQALYGRPPSDYDWVYAYADNAEQLRYELAASPQMFIVNDWAENHRFLFKQEYGGAY